MQVQIKRQLKIELDQADITLAVKNFLAEAGHIISDADLAKINYVKSPQTGLRAELSINDEVVAEDAPLPVVVAESRISVTDTADTVEQAVDQLLATQNEPEPTEDVDTESAAPGEVETSTVDDVALNALDAIAEAESTDEVETPVADEGTIRKS